MLLKRDSMQPLTGAFPWLQAQSMPEVEDLDDEERSTLSAIQLQKKKLAAAHRLKKGAANNQALLPRRADAQRLSTTTNLKVGPRCCRLGLPGSDMSFVHCALSRFTVSAYQPSVLTSSLSAAAMLCPK